MLVRKCASVIDLRNINGSPLREINSEIQSSTKISKMTVYGFDVMLLHISPLIAFSRRMQLSAAILRFKVQAEQLVEAK